MCAWASRDRACRGQRKVTLPALPPSGGEQGRAVARRYVQLPDVGAALFKVSVALAQLHAADAVDGNVQVHDGVQRGLAGGLGLTAVQQLLAVPVPRWPVSTGPAELGGDQAILPGRLGKVPCSRPYLMSASVSWQFSAVRALSGTPSPSSLPR